MQAPAAESAVLDLHAALGATIGACAARGALDEAAATQALEALLSHAHQRWAKPNPQSSPNSNPNTNPNPNPNPSILTLTPTLTRWATLLAQCGGSQPQPAALTAGGGAAAKEAGALLRLMARVADACCGAAMDAAGGGAAGGRVALVCVLRAVGAAL